MSISTIIIFIVALPLLCAILSFYCVFQTIRVLRLQFRLHNSISLVELKAARLHYWVFSLISLLLAFYTFSQLFDPLAPEATLLRNSFRITRIYANVILSFLFLMLFCLLGLMLTLANARGAVVDRGIHTGFHYIDWYHLHNYIIDEAHSVVILTSNKKTFLTLSGTTPPLKVAKNDISKLIFILNKNKNRFTTKIDDAE